jgi:hypothetical protein
VAFPVLYERLELFYCFDTFFARNGVVGACKHRRSRCDTPGDVFSSSFVEVALVAKLLSVLAKGLEKRLLNHT